MHNALIISGMVFTNTFLSISHSLAHKLGEAFHVTHDRTNSILLLHVITFNKRS